jgi:hypothetical protein
MSTVSGSRGVLMFVPRSVELRKQGLRRIPGQYNVWARESYVRELEETRAVRRVQSVLITGIVADPVETALYLNLGSWGDIMMKAEAHHDARYMAMSSTEFISAMKSGVLSKTDVRRIFAKRNEAKATPIVIPRSSPESEYRYWKREYTDFGHLYFSSQEQQDEALEELEERYGPKTNTAWAALLE